MKKKQLIKYIPFMILLILMSCNTSSDAYKLIWLERGDLKLGILPDVGGRVIYLGLKGCGNILKADSDLWKEHPSQKPGMDMVNNYKPYWGHMVWPSPMDEWWQRQDLYLDKKSNKDRWPPDPYLIYGRFESKVDKKRITLTGPKSPITGLQFIHCFELLDGNRIQFSTRAKNTGADTLSWGLWTNMQLPGKCQCYVPISNADTIWFKKNVLADQDTIPYKKLNGYFTFSPNEIEGQKPSWMKVCIHPAEPYMAAFSGNQMILINFPKLSRDCIYSSQEQLEIFNLLTSDHAENLLELETHSAYDTLTPDEFTETSQTWSLFLYNGTKNAHNHIDFIKTITDKKEL